MDDYEDPEATAEWLGNQKVEVENYLTAGKVRHGGVSENPAWFIAPYVSLWRIGSVIAPGKIGWWAICGDLPTDYVTAKAGMDAREVIRTFAQRWLEVSAYMREGKAHPSITIGTEETRVELGELLRIRGSALLGWSEDYDIEF